MAYLGKYVLQVSHVFLHSKKALRFLAILTSEQFHTQVSKSSVNSVLKKSALSSSVGRRYGSAARSEKFSIPSVKKDQISKSMREVGFRKEALSLEEEKGHVQEKRENKEKAFLNEERECLEQKQDQGEKKAPLEPDLVKEKEEEALFLELPAEEKIAEEKEENEELSVEIPEEQGFSGHVEELRKGRRSQGTAISDSAGFVRTTRAVSMGSNNTKNIITAGSHYGIQQDQGPGFFGSRGI